MTTAHDAGAVLARQRWGSSVVRSAVATVVERKAELDEALKAELREVIAEPAQDGEDAA
jgi:hypothetical protein